MLFFPIKIDFHPTLAVFELIMLLLSINVIFFFSIFYPNHFHIIGVHGSNLMHWKMHQCTKFMFRQYTISILCRLCKQYKPNVLILRQK